MKNWSDQHNFGRQVTLLVDHGGSFFVKPRSCYWENFFFGNSSPIKTALNSYVKSGSSIELELIFGLDFKKLESHESVVRKVANLFLEESDKTFYYFGVLLGYCYSFGIFDLHKENLVLMNKTSLQVIDAEIVLGKMILPQETLLLPFKDLSFESCGMSLISNTSKLKGDPLFKLIAGFAEVIQLIERAMNPILEIVNSKELSTNPVRVIFRRTPHYVAYLNGTLKIDDLLPEEEIQLSRGDVPYFFINRGTPGLHYYSSSEWAQSQVRHLGKFQAVYDRMSAPLETFLSSEVLLKEKLPHGVLYLLKHLAAESDFTQDFGDLKIKRGTKVAEVIYQNAKYQAEI